jgi:hypothetical protein
METNRILRKIHGQKITAKLPNEIAEGGGNWKVYGMTKLCAAPYRLDVSLVALG